MFFNHVADGKTVIDDTYNANVRSTEAAIKVLSTQPDPVLIMGDMAELGIAAQEQHADIGELANHYGIEKLLACGNYSEAITSRFLGDSKSFMQQSELLQYLSQHVNFANTFLVKGSRSAGMERVVEHLLELFSECNARGG